MTPASPTPPAFYYLTNFERALAWLGERYDDLFDAREHAFVRQFATLPQASRALLVRMLMRNGSDFRASKLVYDEIGCTLDAAAPLVELGWVDPAPALTLDELFALSTKADLLRIFPALAAHAGERKPEWLERLRPAHDTAQPLDAWCAQAGDRVLRVTVGALCDRLRLMFFGNLHQDWSEFVLADLGVFQYESVPIAPSSRAFQQRGDVDAYLALQMCRDALDVWPDDLPFDDLMRAIDAVGCAQPWLATRRAKLLFALGQTCERRADWDAALDAYARSAWPGSRHRRIRVLERDGRDDEALALALDARTGFESDEERQRVERMLPRLQRRAGQRVERAAAAADVPRETLVLARPDAFVSVEFAVRDHLAEPAAPVHYVENTLINSLFGLLCWEPVFAAVPGAFFHPFQRGPADLHAPDFGPRRAAAFDACFAQLDSGAYRDTIRRHAATKAGLQSPFVFWGVLTDELLDEALACLPPEHLRLWFTRLLADIRSNRSGLPDLVRFWPGERRYELIEVKGPGDRLQDNQTRWLAYCIAHGMPVRVVDVEWAGEGVAHAEAAGLSA
ncbi:MAG: VRR-NUC domain-containing protein [Burkholderia sp.]|uniref:VRR-NUC domain-containing protein n=2 Tax=Burkholderiaceae TaxID=119060 RepID=UPI00158A7653|nr:MULTISPECIES: VRR-NUC domain-containing protein [Burkholderia]MCA3776486.1 VRR-NUC domain-containing protein [Burkholderia sp.]MCA3788588.1 VRR-NUC domain-containing protein [Burkholderia sp.]MCA3798883.1 VRR-NUC domain-containing protein [Burkholderia sp.]MCA3802555.1 VRR-NUC domain-containing protein [Burkholderia sp.]MCA3811021.1 VRR-NUC domain-containing protein [Burkholderia sp.]